MNVFYNINIYAYNGAQEKAVCEALAEKLGHKKIEIEEGFEDSDIEDGVSAVAKRFPDVIIEVNADYDGEVARTRYRGELTESSEDDVFLDILTPEEEETVFSLAAERYDKAFEGLCQAAVRRIAVILKFITGGRNTYVSLAQLNVDGPYCRVSQDEDGYGGKTSCAVEGFLNGGEALALEDGMEKDIDELDAEEIKKVVRCVEMLKEELAKGSVIAVRDEEEGIITLRYAAQAA